MKEIGKILIYLLATVVLGALFAPALFWTGQIILSYGLEYRLVASHEVAGQWIATGSLSFLESDFQRYFDRAMLFAAIILLWPLARSLRIGSWRELNLRRDPRRWRRFGFGFFIAFASLAIMGLCLVFWDVYRLRHLISWKQIALLPFTALAVSIIEEFLFRGAIQGAVQRSAANYVSMIFVSALFAIVHFLKPPEHAIATNDVDWFSGLLLVPQTFWQFAKPQLAVGGFTTLFFVGMVLAYARLRTHALSLSIGLHAGWIVGKMAFNKIARRGGDAWPWFGPDLLVGLVPVLVVLFTGLVVWWWLNYVDPETRDSRW